MSVIPLSILTKKRLSVCINAEDKAHLTGKHLFHIVYIDEIETVRKLQKHTTLQDAFNTMTKIVSSNDFISFCELYVVESEGKNE